MLDCCVAWHDVMHTGRKQYLFSTVLLVLVDYKVLKTLGYVLDSHLEEHPSESGLNWHDLPNF